MDSSLVTLVTNNPTAGMLVLMLLAIIFQFRAARLSDKAHLADVKATNDVYSHDTREIAKSLEENARGIADRNRINQSFADVLRTQADAMNRQSALFEANFGRVIDRIQTQDRRLEMMEQAFSAVAASLREVHKTSQQSHGRG